MFQSKQRLQLITWCVLLYMLATYAFEYGGNGDDAYWHIKVGEWILSHWQVPTNGIFSYTSANKPYMSHEWLSAVVLYKVFQYTGWAGLVFLALLSVLISMILLLSFLLKRLSTVQSLIFVLFACLLMQAHFLPRPHILAIPIMIYWTARIVDASEKQTEPPYFILPLMVLWVNMHGSFVVGIVLSIFFAIEAIFYAVPKTRKHLIFRWSLFITAAMLCSVITPYGIDGILMSVKTDYQNYIMERIVEWHSPDFHIYQPLEVWLLCFLGLVLLQGIKLPVFRIIFLLLLLHLSLKHLRYSCDFLSVLSPLILATPLANHWHSKPEMSFKEFCPKTCKGLLMLSIYFCGLYFYLAHIKVIESKQNQLIQKVLQVLKPEQQQLGNVLNQYSKGDFLIHLDYLTFIDPRAEQLYDNKFSKNYFDAIDLIESSKKLEDLIAKYHITWTLFDTDAPINTYLATQSQWHKLYSDKVVTLFVHQSVKLSTQTLASLKKIEKQSLEQ